VHAVGQPSLDAADLLAVEGELEQAERASFVSATS
jgi:hypothetical protein